jgi:hypothetical protein
MSEAPELPAIMQNAREDLAGNLQGDFSPDDWEQILERCALDLKASAKPTAEAWMDVIRTFHRERYWGFIPNYKKPKPLPHEENLGVRFVLYAARSFMVTKVIVLYAGARWTFGGGPVWGWIFFAAIVFMLSSYGRFLWKYGRNRKDEEYEKSRRAKPI